MFARSFGRAATFKLRRSREILCVVLLAVFGPFEARVSAESVSVPNGSFESPPTQFVDIAISQWQKTPKPDWFDESGGNLWIQLTGVFTNTAPGSASYIDNLDGGQALFLFAVPQAGIFQDNNTVGSADSAPSHAFNSKYEVGKTYDLTVGLVGGGGNMTEGSTLLLSLYYRDASSNMVTIEGTTVTYSKFVFTNTTHMVDYTVHLPTVAATNAWAGKNIGIQIVSTVAPDKAAGYWDVDNVRLTARQEILVPNGSFESPSTQFVDIFPAEWQKTPKPDWYDESGGNLWIQLSGIFTNTAPGSSDSIDNLDRGQALFLFSVPQAGIFQDFNTIGGTNAAPTHAFDAKYEPGKSYELSLGLIGGAGNMPEGASLLVGLYYRNASNEMVTVAATNVVFTKAAFPTVTHLIEKSVRTPTVSASDAWAGKNIGIEIVSSVQDPRQAGGYWDLDNVRLFVAGDAGLRLTVARSGTDLRISWPTATGVSYQLRMSEDLKTWTNQGTALTGTGSEGSVVVPTGARPHAFFTVVATPAP